MHPNYLDLILILNMDFKIKNWPLSSLGRPSSKRQIMEVIEVDQLEEEKKAELSYATLGTTIKLD